MHPRIDQIFGALTSGAQRTTPIGPPRQSAVSPVGFSSNPSREGISMPDISKSGHLKPVRPELKLDLEA